MRRSRWVFPFAAGVVSTLLAVAAVEWAAPEVSSRIRSALQPGIAMQGAPADTAPAAPGPAAATPAADSARQAPFAGVAR